MNYTPMDRFRDALSGRPKDRIPVFPMISGWAVANYADAPPEDVAQQPELSVEVQIKAREALGYDYLQVYSGYSAVHEAFGCKVQHRKTEQIIEPLTQPLESMSDVGNIRLPDPREGGRLSEVHTMVRLMKDYAGSAIPVLAGFEGPFTAACRLFEADRIMRMVYRNAPVLEAVLDRINGFLAAFSRALVDNGATTLIMYEPTASASMISPAMFHRFVLPRLKELIGGMRVPCILHICGNTAPMLKAMAQTGADLLSLDQCMDLAASRQTAPETALGGNVDPINSLLMGTRERVVEDTTHCLRAGGASRFVLMSGCGIPADTPEENLKAMIETAAHPIHLDCEPSM